MFFFFKQKTAYEMRISDWSSDVCPSDLAVQAQARRAMCHGIPADRARRSATMHDRRAENSKACAILQGPKSAGSAPHPQSTVNNGPNVPVHGGRIRSFPATQP